MTSEARWEKTLWLLPCSLAFITLGEANHHVMRALNQLVECPHVSQLPAPCKYVIMEADPSVQLSLQISVTEASIVTGNSRV
jgi:hypothetical protein